METFFLAFWVVVAYLLGSVSSAIIVSRLMSLPDPRAGGSNNPGATNVLRLSGKVPAILTLLGDALKGFIPVILARLFGFSPFFLGLIALAAVVGHIFPVFFGFKGGKGVATYFGALFAMSFWTGILALVVWLAVALVTRYSSLAALCAAVAVTLLGPFLMGQFLSILSLLLIFLVLAYRHKDNIIRLRDGTENKISFS